MVLIFWVVLALAALFPASAAGSEVGPPKPALPYLFSVPGLADDLAAKLELAPGDRRRIEAIVAAEDRRLKELKRLSDARLGSIAAVRNSEAPRVNQARVNGEVLSFNAEVRGRERAARADVAATLGERFVEFDAWEEESFSREAAVHGIDGFEAAAQGASPKVYATQYFAYTNYEAAIPDKYIKFANLDWQHQPGYEGSNYAVDLAWSGTEVKGVKILDVGPWNIDDNYWNSPDAAVRPRRLFRDLPRGMPEAQAAFFDNYNGGLDQFGREVLNPAGIDLSPAVAQDLGLGYLQNGWIDVTYNWEAGNFGVTKVSVPGYSTKISKTPTFRISWTGADPAFTAGLSSYDVQYRPANSATWTTWKSKTTLTAAAFPGTTGRTYYFRARARSTDGTVGRWSPIRRTIVPYDQDKLRLRKVGFNRLFEGPNSGYYLSSTRYGTARGTYVVYKFTGRGIGLISTLGPNRSKAQIYLDGRRVKTIDNYASKTRTRRLVFNHTWEKSGTHYLKVVNLATPGRARFDIEGVAVGR